MEQRKATKKQRAVELFRQGKSVPEIAHRLETSASYVANALIESGHVPDYVDLYTSTGPQNPYAWRLRGVLRFRNVEAARKSVARIDRLYQQFAAERDRRGMHQCQVLALIGKNRAEGIGKYEEARLFAGWLREHLDVVEAEAEELPRAA